MALSKTPRRPPRRAMRNGADPEAPLAATPERIVAEYAALAFSDMRRFLAWGPDGVELRPSDTLTADEARCVAEISETAAGGRRIKLHDKKGALDSLARCLGMFVERHELSGRDGAAIPLAAAPDLAALTDGELRTLEALLAKTVRANGDALAHAAVDDGAGRMGDAPAS